MMGNVAQLTMKEIIYLYVDKINVNPNQPRKFFSKQSLEELANSIKEHGILQPISIRFDGKNYELIAGERRLRASKLAGLKYIPCIIVNIDEEKSAVLAIIENLQRENLNFIEEAEGYHNLIKDYNYTQEDLAKKIGKNQSTIANKLRLLKLDDTAKNMLIEHNLTERHGRALLKLNSDESRLEILDKVIKENLNVAKTESLIENYLTKEENKEISASEKKRKQKLKIIIRDVRIFINSIRRSVEMMQKSGIEANYEVNQSSTGYQIIINIKSEV